MLSSDVAYGDTEQEISPTEWCQVSQKYSSPSQHLPKGISEVLWTKTAAFL
jgi:hypothetical protein